MGYRFNVAASVEDEVRRIAREQIRKAVRDLDNDEMSVDDTVHEVRKRCKKVRGLIRLVRPAMPDYRKANERIRDAARLLSDVRDATTRIESVDALASHGGQPVVDLLAPLRDRLVQTRDALTQTDETRDRLAQFREAITEIDGFAAGWRVKKSGFDALAGGFAKTYNRCRETMNDALRKPTTERLHEWRKRAKYHRYHLQLIEPTWHGPIGAIREEAVRLTDLLGDDHDLAVLDEQLRAWADREREVASKLESVHNVIELRRGELQTAARPLGRRLTALGTDAFVESARNVWNAAAPLE